MAAKKRTPAAMKAAGAPARPPLPDPVSPLRPGDLTHLDVHDAIRHVLSVHTVLLEEMNERLALLEGERP